MDADHVARPELADWPLVLSADVGGDPDAGITFALAAMTEPRLKFAGNGFLAVRLSHFARR